VSAQIVRGARPEEHDALLGLVLAAYGEFGSFLTAQFVQEFREDVIRLMNDENTEVLVAEEDGSVVGTITFYPDGPDYNDEIPAAWACLRTLAVLPSARGRGAGRMLMNECIGRARGLGRTRILLHTMPFMSSAIALHEKLGFRRMPELDVEYGSGTTVVAYVLDLDAGVF